MQEDADIRDIWFEIDVMLEATERYKVNSSIVRKALEQINFWDEVNVDKTIEDVLQKIEQKVIELKDKDLES